MLTRARRYAAPLAVALASAALVLGPALRPGLTLAYDLGWSPDPRFTPFVTGAGMVAPRAVPSDAFGVALGLALGAGIAQKLVLLTVLVLCGLGPAVLLRALRPQAPAGALSAAALAGIWNPFVAERVAIGQWTIVLGYALTGFALAALVRPLAGSTPRIPAGPAPEPGGGSPDGRSSTAAVAGWVGLAGVGGANTLAIVVAAVLAALAVPGTPHRFRTATASLLTALGVGAVWALPALTAQAAGDPAGAQVFAPRADTPFGVLGSLLSGGGMWNLASHPPARAAWLPAAGASLLALACASLVVRLARRQQAARPVLAAGLAGLAVPALAALPGTGTAWSALLGHLPGGGILRDSHKLLAAWVVLLALGLGLVVERLLRARLIVPAAVAALLALALQPTLAWGVGGRWRPVTVPADYRAAARLLSDLPAGPVGVLPWNQYRRYPWNDNRIALSILPRLVDQVVVQNDALPTSARTVAGEDPRAARVTAALARGSDPFAALRAAGCRYAVLEADAGAPVPPPPAGARILARGESVTVLELAGVAATPGALPPPDPPPHWPIRLGWAGTLMAWTGVIAGQRPRQKRAGRAA